jgi:hypothetical protein
VTDTHHNYTLKPEHNYTLSTTTLWEGIYEFFFAAGLAGTQRQ